MCLFPLLEQQEAEQIYSTLYQDGKVSYQPTHQHDTSSKQVDAVYELATSVGQ